MAWTLRGWHAALVRAICLVTVLVAAHALMPGAAGAVTYADQNPSYSGQAVLSSARCGSFDAPSSPYCRVTWLPTPCVDCAGARTFDLVAYRWTGSSWSAESLPSGIRVYHWPFGSGWSWVWLSSSRGWYAIRSSLVIAGVPACVNCPPVGG